jgi:hypothetical protein
MENKKEIKSVVKTPYLLSLQQQVNQSLSPILKNHISSKSHGRSIRYQTHLAA